jgi:hypothetical protein
MFETACAIPVDRPRRAGFLACASFLSLALCSTGCLFQKKPQARVFRPPPPPPSAAANLKLPAISDPPELVIEVADGSEQLIVVGSGITQFPPPPRPAAASARRPQPAKPAAPPAAIETPATPRITQILTPEQLKETNKLLDDAMDRVQKALDALAKKRLNAEQRDRMGQIRELQTQVNKMRGEDLEAAVSQARRADLLARDLLDHLP